LPYSLIYFALMLGSIIGLIMLMVNPAKPEVLGSQNVVLATKSLSMEDRYNVPSVNTVFKDNILLTMAYMDGVVTSKADLSWDKVQAPFKYEFTLKPGEVFAFHEYTLPAYTKNVVKTTGVNFNWDEGFKSDGFMVGDGVCHLASIFYWAAKDAGLATYAPSNHNFAKINDVPKEYGVAIEAPSPLGNLYITNNLDKPVSFEFSYDGSNLTTTVVKEA
jgi:hypothetical protein